ncbi:hypothetical protein CQW23_02297 [Capsicum baccatum]|uniref:Uncharacterized protein n=1 Tax=Capsicum baccatum TaxID=33114 RepID=A0A2G2XR16_CAPBA|nr:hypothetical protein CQW23_02297 [Capsicum baccatum]
MLERSENIVWVGGPSQIEQFCKKWRPYRSIGAWYMWRLIEGNGTPTTVAIVMEGGHVQPLQQIEPQQEPFSYDNCKKGSEITSKFRNIAFDWFGRKSFHTNCCGPKFAKQGHKEPAFCGMLFREKQHTFLDYLAWGYELNFMVAIDFTANIWHFTPYLQDCFNILIVLSSSGWKKGDLFLDDVNAQLKKKNITTDIKLDSSSNVSSTILSSISLLILSSHSCMVLLDFCSSSLVVI